MKKTKRNNMKKKTKTKKNKHNKHNKSKKWYTAIDVAQKVLTKTGSLSKARVALRVQAAHNARKLFGPLS
jgi:hypothetical protein